MRGARSELALTAFHIIGRGISAKMLNFVFVKSKFNGEIFTEPFVIRSV